VISCDFLNGVGMAWVFDDQINMQIQRLLKLGLAAQFSHKVAVFWFDVKIHIATPALVVDPRAEQPHARLRAKTLGGAGQYGLALLRSETHQLIVLPDPPSCKLTMLERAARLYGEQNGARIVHALLTYLFHVTPLAPDTVRGLLTHPRPELEDAMLTAAQQLYERGRHEGKLEGKLEGEAELLRRLLEHKFASLTRRLQRRLAEADEATLQMWSLRLLTAATLEEVFPKASRRRPPA
jgi:hypothetical protein